jgi:hypothetical protein
MKRFVITVSRLIALSATLTIVAFSQDAWSHEYGINDLPFEVEMRRLDSVAKALKSDSNKMVYLIGFNKSGKSKATAWNRIRRSRGYLIKKHHIAADRIKLLYGKTQNGLIMKISIIDKRAKQATTISECIVSTPKYIDQ